MRRHVTHEGKPWRYSSRPERVYETQSDGAIASPAFADPPSTSI